MKILMILLLVVLMPVTRLPAGILNVVHSFGTPLGNIGVEPAAGLVAGPDGTLYGTTTFGGTHDCGVVYALATNGECLVLWNFANGSDGADPYGDLVLSGNTLYGTTAGTGGGGSLGNVFKINQDGSGFASLYNFTNGSDGSFPEAGLILDGGVLYGTASEGGDGGDGTVFKVNTNGSGFAVLKAFTARDPVSDTNVDGAFPHASLVLSNGTLFGTAPYGGDNNQGTVFAVQTNGSGFQTLHAFATGEGSQPQAGLTLIGGTLYGTTYGGAAGSGTIFSLNTDGSGFDTIHALAADDSEGSAPGGSLAVMGGTLYGTTTFGGANGNGTIFAVSPDGSYFKVLYTFSALDPDYDDNYDGANPVGSLLVYNGVLYGTASSGGPVEYFGYFGTIFQINPDGSDFTTDYYFDDTTSYTDGAYPQGTLVAGGGTLYGMVIYGGLYGDGTVFKVNGDGTGFSLLHQFSGTDGENPMGSLLLAGNTLYGLTPTGGAHYKGNVFSINTDGTGFTNLYSFTGGLDGSLPYGGLILVSNLLYGTTSACGSNYLGTVFCIGPDGSGFKSLHAFTGSDGSSPQAGLVAGDGTLYGEAYSGGNGVGTLFKLQTDGTGFAVLRNFSFITGEGAAGEGANPIGGLILSGTTLYGTTYDGGDSHVGNVFKIGTDGLNYATLWNFDNLSTGYPQINEYGAKPLGGVVLVGNLLYGTASIGGSGGAGTLFEVSTNSNAFTGFTNLYNFGTGEIGYGYPEGGLVLDGASLCGLSNTGGDYDYGTVFAYALVPALQITTTGNAPVIFWQEDGLNHTLQTTTNLTAAIWLNAAALNWTNAPYIGLQLTNPPLAPTAFFRLQQ